jgi:hypothetical protein
MTSLKSLSKRLSVIGFLLVSFMGYASPVQYIALRGLDKVSAKVFKMDVAVGKQVKFGSLEIQVLQADCNPPEQRPECKARLQISEKGKELFHGWMFASDPAVCALEHPVYDVWVVVS